MRTFIVYACLLIALCLTVSNAALSLNALQQGATVGANIGSGIQPLSVSRYHGIFYVDNLDQNFSNNTISDFKVEISNTVGDLGQCVAIVRYFDSFKRELMDSYQAVSDAQPSSTAYIWQFKHSGTISARPSLVFRCNKPLTSGFTLRYSVFASSPIVPIYSPLLEVRGQTSLASSMTFALPKFEPIVKPVQNAFYSQIYVTISSTFGMLAFPAIVSLFLLFHCQFLQ